MDVGAWEEILPDCHHKVSVLIIIIVQLPQHTAAVVVVTVANATVAIATDVDSLCVSTDNAITADAADATHTTTITADAADATHTTTITVDAAFIISCYIISHQKLSWKFLRRELLTVQSAFFLCGSRTCRP